MLKIVIDPLEDLKMKLANRYLVIVITLFIVSVAVRPAAGSAKTQPTAEAVVEELYRLVTFEAGTTPDWDRVRSLFAEEAVVVLRTGREEMTIFTLEGFVNDFVQFIENRDVEKTGFTERILKMKSTVYGDIAHVLVLFDSHIPGTETDPRPGLDSFQLIRQAGEWRILSITNDRPSPDNPIPDSLFR